MFGNAMRVMGPPPRRTQIKGQDHMLAYINDEEASLLKALGGAGKPVHGVPAFYDEGDDYGGPGGDQSAGADGTQGSGNNNAGSGADNDRSGNQSNNNASNTDDAYDNQQTSSNNAPNDPSEESWDDWEYDAYEPTQNNNNMTKQDQDLVDAIQSMIDNGRINPNSDSTNQQLTAIASGLIPGLSVEDRIQAATDLGRRVAMGEQEDADGNKSYDLSFLGGANYNDWKNYNTSDEITNQQMAEAFAKGFNSQTGAKGWDPFGLDLNIGKGFGGTRLGMLPNGDITIQSGGSYAAQNLANAGLLAGGMYVGGVPGSALSNLSVNMGQSPGSWNKFGPNTPRTNNLNVDFDAMNFATGQLVGPLVNKTIGKPIGQTIYDQTNNPYLATTGAAASATLVNKAIKDQLAQAGVDGTVNVASIDMNNGQLNPNVNTGKGTATKGTATTTVQSDLADDTLNNPATDGSGQKSVAQTSFSSSVGSGDPSTNFFQDAKAELSKNLAVGDQKIGTTTGDGSMKDGTSSADYSTFADKASPPKGGSNDGGNNQPTDTGASWDKLYSNIKNIVEDGQNTTGQSYLSPISYLSPVTSGKGFGNYLTQGKNRDFGSATFRASTKGEIDRSKRRSGFGNIMFA